MKDYCEWTPSAMWIDEPRFERRGYKRLILREKGVVSMDDEIYEVTVLSLSPKGGLLDFREKVGFRKNKKFKLSLEPANSILIMHFEGIVVQCRDNLVGVEFVPV